MARTFTYLVAGSLVRQVRQCSTNCWHTIITSHCVRENVIAAKVCGIGAGTRPALNRLQPGGVRMMACIALSLERQVKIPAGTAMLLAGGEALERHRCL